MSVLNEIERLINRLWEILAKSKKEGSQIRAKALNINCQI